jgi:hypothetical protein
MEAFGFSDAAVVMLGSGVTSLVIALCCLAVGVLFGKKGWFRAGIWFIVISAVLIGLGTTLNLCLIGVTILVVWVLSIVSKKLYDPAHVPTPAVVPAPTPVPTSTPIATPTPVTPVTTATPVSTTRIGTAGVFRWILGILFGILIILLVLGSLGFVFRGSDYLDLVANIFGGFYFGVVAGYRILLLFVLAVSGLILSGRRRTT